MTARTFSATQPIWHVVGKSGREGKQEKKTTIGCAA